MTIPETLIPRLQAVVGTSGVCTEGERTTAYAIDARKPEVVVRPENIEQAVEVVTLAGRERLAMVPWGQGTQMHLGKAPERYDMALSLAGLTRLVDYDVANLTVIAEAGLAVRELYKVSVPERQFPPLGFPGSMASLGGLLVTNTSGVKRLRYGSLRDLLLGVRVVVPDGACVHFGGRVVKNVAGYDMNKLFVGSLGAFGVVLETTYRLAALPEDDRALAMVFPGLKQAAAAAAAVQASQLLPSALTLVQADTAIAYAAFASLSVIAPQVVLVLNFDGMHETVERQLRDSRRFGQQHGAVAELLVGGEDLLHVWEFQESWRAAPDEANRERLQIRLGTLPNRLQDAMQPLMAAQTFCQQGAGWIADYSNGLIFAHLPLDQAQGSDLHPAVQDWLQHMRRQIENLPAYCVVEYAPAALRQHLDVWGEPPGHRLLRLYKQRFDPYAVLNPGRYVAGL